MNTKAACILFTILYFIMHHTVLAQSGSARWLLKPSAYSMALGGTGTGSYSVQFDTHDLPSGDYYYTLEGGAYIQVRKMKLVK